MKLKKTIADALDGAYLKLARIGEEGQRKFNGIMSLALWIFIFFQSLWGLIDHWVYPVEAWYESVWPYRSTNYRSLFSEGVGGSWWFFPCRCTSPTGHPSDAAR